MFFGIGKIINDINYGFLVDLHMYSAASTILELSEYYGSTNKTIAKIKGFNEIADKMYQHLEKNNIISIKGKLLTNGFIEVINFKVL